MNLDYTKVTHEQLLDQFRNRLLTDPRYKNLSAAAIFQLYMEMMTGTFDMLHFYLGRTAEEMFFDSARLDSSVIKLAKNLGYNPKRAIPATAEIAIKLNGPLPANAAAGDTIWFNNELLELSFNNLPYKLDRCYSYTLKPEDIADGVGNAAWSKVIVYSEPKGITNGWIPIVENADKLDRIKVVQCSIQTAEIYAVAHADNLGASYQFYDVDDLSFSNWYGKRDPFAYMEDIYTPANAWCKVGIGLNKQDAFSPEKLCDIEIENVYCNSRVKALNGDLTDTKKLNVCRIESNADKTTRITFGDGTLVNNGFNNEDEILYVQYVSTSGYIANTPDVVGYTLDNKSKLMAHAPGKLYDVTNNVSFVLTTNISNGADFESQQSIKNNAAVYFASRGQLINKKDFNAYFSTLSTPIQAKNAIAWTAGDLKNGTASDDYNELQSKIEAAKNTVYYTVIGDVYESFGNDRYKVKDFYNSDDTTVVGSTTLYNNKNTFLGHVSDLAYTFNDATAAQTVAEAQANVANAASDPFLLNTKEIWKDIEEKLPFGVMPISIPPIVQYFDLVGNVEIDRTTNVADYQAALESKIYKWLVDRQKFNNKIYKSDLIKLIYENAATKSVNVDLTPSGLTRKSAETFRFDNENDLQSVSADANVVYINSTKHCQNNVIILPRRAAAYYRANEEGNGLSNISEALLRSVDMISIACSSTDTKPNSYIKVSINSITELADGRFCVTLNDGYYDFYHTGDTHFWLQIDEEPVTFYDDAIKQESGVIDALLAQVTDDAVNSTTDTAVHLPYDASVSGETTSKEERLLTFLRRSNPYSTHCFNEKSFNLVYAASYSAEQYLAVYRYIKWILEDSILDDNNNIVNFTLPNEIAVVRVRLNYTYGR